MPLWSADFSDCSLEDIFRLKLVNRAWSKTLRFENSTLVNNRLAHLIGRDEYMLNRRNGLENSIECRRRSEVLTKEIDSRRDLAARELRRPPITLPGMPGDFEAESLRRKSLLQA